MRTSAQGWAAPAFGLFGLGITLYFAAQGAGNVVAPVGASVLRFVLVLLLGPMVVAGAAGPWALFALVGAAMAVYGIATALGVPYSTWRAPPRREVPAAGAMRPS